MITWLLVYIFTPKSKRTEQMNLDWNWFWKVELPDWWENISPFPGRPPRVDSDDDDVPF